MTQHIIKRNASDFDKILRVFRKHERGYDVDVIFNKQRIPLHSVILGGNSRYFEINLFSTPIVPKAIIIENGNSKTFKSIIEYCYWGKMKLDQKNAIDILEVAHFLMVQPVIDGCFRILLSTLDLKNCFSTWKLARKLRLISLENSAIDYIRTAFYGITEDFLTINLIQLIKILQSKLFNCAREKYLILINEWIKHDPEVRKENLMTLLKHVQLEKLPMEFLVPESKIMCHDKSCYDLFLDAIYKPKNLEVSEFNHDESTLIVLGGCYSDQSKVAEIYDTNSNIWRQCEVEFGKKSFSCVFYEQKIFVLGGVFSNTVECYDIKSWRKTSLAPMHKDRHYFPSVVVDEKIYVIEGFSRDSTSSFVERYDVKANQWMQLTSMPTVRWTHKAAVVDGEIFVVGGLYKDKERLSVNECYTISTGKWRSCKPMQEKREGPAVAAVHGLVYAAGGHNGSVYLSSVERYDPKVDQWTFIEPLPSPRCGAILVNVCDSLIISGGYSNNKAIGTVEKYDLLTKRWSPMASLNKARWHHNMVVVPQHLLD